MMSDAVQHPVLSNSVLPISGSDVAAKPPYPPEMAPEMEMILECARVCLGTGDQTRIEALLPACLNWPRVRRIAAAHRVSLLLHPALKKCGADLVPSAVLPELRADTSGTVLQRLALVGELVKILALFEAEGIPALPFKGPAVAYSLYGGLALRGFGDLDILVQEKDIPKATALLVGRGYHAPAQIADTAKRPFLQFQPFLESPQSQRVFNFHRADGTVVELHWQFTPRHFPFPLTESGLWDRLACVDLPGQKALNLSPEDMLLLLCVHGSKHCWERLIWICDIAALVGALPDLRWDAVLARARQLRVERMVHVGLLLAQDITHAAVPPGPLQAARDDREAARLAAWVGSRLLQKPLDPLGETEEYRFVFKVRESGRDRLRYVLHLLMTPAQEDWDFLRLPGSLAPFYYVVRPARLMYVFLQRRLSPKTTPLAGQADLERE